MNESIATALAEQTPATVPQTSTGTEIATTRQAQEVQAAMIVARRFPRDTTAAIARITESCKRPLLAQRAVYQYKKGGQQISGPSIRLAEAMAQAWGNLDFGVIELSREGGKSEVMTYCWDLETNTRQQKVFTIKHWVDTKQGGRNTRDERETYETVANLAARRMRACILGIIPGDVQELAVDQCKRTLMGKSDLPLVDRVRNMVVAFADHGVTQEMIEVKVQHPVAACDVFELTRMIEVYNSIRDGMSVREDHFDVPGVVDVATAQVTADELMGKSTEPEPEPPADAAPEFDRLEVGGQLMAATTLSEINTIVSRYSTVSSSIDDAEWFAEKVKQAKDDVSSSRGEGSNEQGDLLD
jgi:hypothetical protein